MFSFNKIQNWFISASRFSEEVAKFCRIQEKSPKKIRRVDRKPRQMAVGERRDSRTTVRSMGTHLFNVKLSVILILRWLECIVLKKNIINVSLLFSVKPSKTISFHQVIQWPSLTYSAHFWKKLYSNLLLKQEDPKSLARWRTNCSEICCRNIKQIVACCPWAGEPGSLLRRDIFLIRAPSFRPTPFRPRHFLPIHFVQSY